MGHKWKEDKQEIGRKTIKALSRPLQELLSKGLSEGDKTRFDKALNALELDEATKTTLLAEVRKEAPGLAASQAEKLMKRCFRRKVNTLRCLGQATLIKIVEEVVPGTAKAAEEAAAACESKAAD